MGQLRSCKDSWLFRLFLRYFRDGCSYRAAYLAYLTLISLVPMLAIAAAILSRLRVFDGIAQSWQFWLVGNLFIGETGSVKPLMTQLINHALSMSWWHILVFLVIALLMMVNIGRAFRSIWHSEPRFSLTFSFLIYLLVLLVSPVLLAMMFIVGGLLNQWLSFLVAQSGYRFLEPVFQISSYVLLFIWFFLMNLVLPACRVPFRAAVFSGLVTTFFLWAARHVFTYFVTYFSTYKELYGPLSVIPVFLVWLYVSWMLILLGALIGHSIERRAGALRG
jgi:membrane protein